MILNKLKVNILGYSMTKTFLAIIPARGGSKRLPRKNVLDLCGKPLIAHSIQAGLKSKYISKVVVSSDDEEIINISKKFGANIIKRPDYLSWLPLLQHWSDWVFTYLPKTIRHICCW